MEYRVGRRLATQFLRYGITGGVALTTHLAVMWVAVETLGTLKPLASAIGFACAIPINYILQYRFVFRSDAEHVASFLRYVAVTLATMVLNVALFWMLLALLQAHYLIVQCVTTVIVLMTNFAVNRTFTFRRSDVRYVPNSGHTDNERVIKPEHACRRMK